MKNLLLIAALITTQPYLTANAQQNQIGNGNIIRNSTIIQGQNNKYIIANIKNIQKIYPTIPAEDKVKINNELDSLRKAIEGISEVARKPQPWATLDETEAPDKIQGRYDEYTNSYKSTTQILKELREKFAKAREKGGLSPNTARILFLIEHEITTTEITIATIIDNLNKNKDSIITEIIREIQIDGQKTRDSFASGLRELREFIAPQPRSFEYTGNFGKVLARGEQVFFTYPSTPLGELEIFGHLSVIRFNTYQATSTLPNFWVQSSPSHNILSAGVGLRQFLGDSTPFKATGRWYVEGLLGKALNNRSFEYSWKLGYSFAPLSISDDGRKIYVSASFGPTFFARVPVTQYQFDPWSDSVESDKSTRKSQYGFSLRLTF